MGRSERGAPIGRAKPRAFHDLVLRLLHRTEYRPRRYQSFAAAVALDALRSRNVLLRLPQGTGKSLVSQLILYAQAARTKYALSPDKPKILVLTPTKELREQYVAMGQWLEMPDPSRHRLRLFNCAEDEASNRPVAQARLKHADIIVSTPKFFFNRLSWFRGNDLNEIGLCIIDEVDLLSISDEAFDDRQRLHEDWRKLIEYLTARQVRTLGLTASELEPDDQDLFRSLSFKEVSPFERSIVPFLPRVRIDPVRCVDGRAQKLDELITAECKVLVGRLRALRNLDQCTTSASFWREIRRIASEGGEAADLARALLKKQRERLDVYEDKNCSATAKMTAVKRLLPIHPALVLCREAELVKELVRQRRGRGVRSAYAEKGDAYLRDIADFKNGRATVLVMTRDLGKRGVDFPDVRTLILYSAKVSVRTMDQELCRSRGQRRRPKVVPILYYARTLDEEKLRTVISQLLDVRMYDAYAKYYLSRSASAWHRKRQRRWHDWFVAAD